MSRCSCFGMHLLGFVAGSFNPEHLDTSWAFQGRSQALPWIVAGFEQKLLDLLHLALLEPLGFASLGSHPWQPNRQALGRLLHQVHQWSYHLQRLIKSSFIAAWPSIGQASLNTAGTSTDEWPSADRWATVARYWFVTARQGFKQLIHLRLPCLLPKRQHPLEVSLEASCLAFLGLP